MYAIVKTGGKQYRVEQDQTLLVERLPDDEGATVALEPVLFRSDDAVFGADALEEGQGRGQDRSGTSAARSCGCSSSSPSAATRSAPGIARSSPASRSTKISNGK